MKRDGRSILLLLGIVRVKGGVMTRDADDDGMKMGDGVMRISGVNGMKVCISVVKVGMNDGKLWW